MKASVLEASSKAFLPETVTSGIWEGGENLPNLLEHSVAPVRIGTGRSDGQRRGGKELPQGETREPINSPRGWGRVSGGHSVL